MILPLNKKQRLRTSESIFGIFTSYGLDSLISRLCVFSAITILPVINAGVAHEWPST